MSENVEDVLESVLVDGDDEFFDVEEASIREELRSFNNKFIIYLL